MRSRPTSSRRLFVGVLAAIAAVFVIGRLWLRHAPLPNSTEASLLPPAPESPAIAAGTSVGATAGD